MISIIVPVYNVHPYLGKCLNSMELIFAGVTTFAASGFHYHYERRDDSLICCNYSEKDAAKAQYHLLELRNKYEPDPALFQRCWNFLKNAQKGKLKKR